MTLQLSRIGGEVVTHKIAKASSGNMRFVLKIALSSLSFILTSSVVVYLLIVKELLNMDKFVVIVDNSFILRSYIQAIRSVAVIFISPPKGYRVDNSILAPRLNNFGFNGIPNTAIHVLDKLTKEEEKDIKLVETKWINARDNNKALLEFLGVLNQEGMRNEKDVQKIVNKYLEMHQKPAVFQSKIEAYVVKTSRFGFEHAYFYDPEKDMYIDDDRVYTKDKSTPA